MTTLIHLYEHPFRGGPPRVFEAASVGEWLLRRYAARRIDHRVFEGVVSAETEISANARRLAENRAPLYVVLETPGFEPISWTAILANLAISTAISFTVSFLFAPDKRNTLDNRTQESANNRLADRTNQVRTLQRVEDIFGTVRAIPSLIAVTYSKYEDHRRVEYSLLCITRGYALVEDVRDGDTPLEAITGASCAVYGPFTSPNSGHAPQLSIGAPISDPVLNVSRSGGVENLVLKAANQLQEEAGVELTLRGPGLAVDTLVPVDSTEDILYQAEPHNGTRRPNFQSIATVGQALTIAGGAHAITAEVPAGTTITVNRIARTYTVSAGAAGLFANVVDGTPIGIPGLVNPGNSDMHTVESHTADSVTVAEAIGDDEATVVGGPGYEISMSVTFAGTRTITGVGDGYVTLAGPAQYGMLGVGELVALTVTIDNGLQDWTDWVTLARTDVTEVWVNVVAPQMYRDNGGQSETAVAYELEVEQLDADTLAPLGVVATATGGLHGATATERAETLELVTGWTGPSRVRMRRTTPYDYGFEGLVVDEVTWADLYAVAPVTVLHFGNKTIAQTVTHATPGAAAVQRRELSCLCSRLLPTYDGAAFSGGFDETGALAWGEIFPTSRVVDILAAVTVDARIGARPIDDLDVAQVWGVQQALDAWHAEVGQFNYTFDRDDLSYEDTVAAIANACFCRAYRQGTQVRLALDAPQAASVALLTHANTKPDTQTLTRRFASESEYDGVELVYADPDSETQETIRVPLDGSWTKLKKVEVSGIRSYPQAWFRACRELARLRYERVAQEITALGNGRALLPNSRVDIADATRFRSWAGEVVGQDGLELTLDGPVEFEAGEPHSIALSTRAGGIMVIACTAGSSARKVVLAAPPAEALVVLPDPMEGVRTTYHFATDSARTADQWQLQSITPEERGQYAKLKLVNYAPEYYEADALPVPPRDTVVN